MNIDELKPQGTTEVPAAPVNAQQASNNSSIQLQNAAVGMSPFANSPEKQVEANQPEVASFTPVDQVIPKESETLVASSPSVVDNTQVPPVAIGGVAQPEVATENKVEQSTQPALDSVLPPNPAPTTVDNAGLPPLPEPTVVPMNNQEVTVVNTERRRTGSNIILVVLALLLVLFVYKIDVVIDFVKDNILVTNPTSPGESSNNNLVEGYIKIDDSTSDYNIKEIRFYNFKKQPDNKLLFNYTSTKNYNKARELNIYIEIYNSNKELLGKYLFDVESVGNSEVGSSILNLGEAVSSYAYFAKVVIYTEEELSKETSFACTFDESNENYLLEYKTTYIFKNNELVKYDVNKKIKVINNNKATSNAISIISKENEDVSKFEIKTTFYDNELTYSIDLSNVNEGYIPYYSKGTTPTIIKMNESAKKWICE